MPVRSKCRICRTGCHYVARRTAWVHDAPGKDHAPIPEQAV